MDGKSYNLKDLKLQNLGIDKEKFGRIFTFVDYGNVNYWYDKDRRDWDNNQLTENKKLIGILTNRDLRFEIDRSKKISELMTKENLVTVPIGTTLEQSKELLHKNRKTLSNCSYSWSKKILSRNFRIPRNFPYFHSLLAEHFPIFLQR